VLLAAQVGWRPRRAPSPAAPPAALAAETGLDHGGDLHAGLDSAPILDFAALKARQPRPAPGLRREGQAQRSA
jgi:hypothetical protein